MIVEMSQLLNGLAKNLPKILERVGEGAIIKAGMMIRTCTVCEVARNRSQEVTSDMK